jgi:hypothetical protein
MTTSQPFPKFVDSDSIPYEEQTVVREIDRAIDDLKKAKALCLDRLAKGKQRQLGIAYGLATTCATTAGMLTIYCDK